MYNEEIAICREAVRFLAGIPAETSLYGLEEYIREALGPAYRVREATRLIPDGCAEKSARNLMTVYALVYLFTGKYPEEIWGEEVTGKENTVGRYKDLLGAYTGGCARLGFPPRLRKLNDESLAFVEHGLRGTLARRFLDVSKVRNANLAEFLSDCAVLKDRYFATRSYGPKDWADLIEKELARAEKKNAPKVERHARFQGWELHGVTMMGNTHAKCDDDAKITRFDRETWFACSADGVGSSPFSHLGSHLAAEAFETRLREAYKHFRRPAELMHYIRFGLAQDAFKLWRKNLRRELKERDPELSDYATTFLFTFACRHFIACGMVGDGNFIVEKRETIREARYGYLDLTDGISGITQTSVITVPHLRKNPRALQVTFFAPDEVSAILMASDGANAIRFGNVEGVLFPQKSDLQSAAEVLAELRGETFESCGAKVRAMCGQFSSSNKCSGGRGDDCTIVYLKNGRV